MLSSFITEETIRLGLEAKDWEEAVYKSGEILLRAGYIKADYIDAMIQSVREAGPYVVIAKHIAMPHAKPSDGALRDGISIVRLKEPVCFGSEDNDPVRYVFALSSVNSSMHLDMMQDFVGLMERPDFFDLLDRAASPAEVFEFIQQFDERGGE